MGFRYFAANAFSVISSIWSLINDEIIGLFD
jgi:hypothetical protein